MKVVAYIYVDRTDAIDAPTLNQQREGIRRWAEANRHVIVREIVDQPDSATVPGFGLTTARWIAGDGRFDQLVVYRLDRLARSLEQVETIIAALEKKGVAFVAVENDLDTSTPGGRLMISLISAFAAVARKIDSDRVSS